MEKFSQIEGYGHLPARCHTKEHTWYKLNNMAGCNTQLFCTHTHIHAHTNWNFETQITGAWWLCWNMRCVTINTTGNECHKKSPLTGIYRLSMITVLLECDFLINEGCRAITFKLWLISICCFNQLEIVLKLHLGPILRSSSRWISAGRYICKAFII